MKIEFQDRTWDFDFVGVTNKQAEKIRAHTGMSLQKWWDSLKESDADDWESRFDALYWVMLQQNDEGAGIGIADVEYPVYQFMLAYMKAYLAEHPVEEAEPDPTQPTAGSAPSQVPSSRKASSGRAGGVKPHG